MRLLLREACQRETPQAAAYEEAPGPRKKRTAFFPGKRMPVTEINNKV
ncbi:hypothetical protein JOC75_000533 [Metabacillus crassostreae]|nr:hypothetical protein [Metabacillus crassostreae]